MARLKKKDLLPALREVDFAPHTVRSGTFAIHNPRAKVKIHIETSKPTKGFQRFLLTDLRLAIVRTVDILQKGISEEHGDGASGFCIKQTNCEFPPSDPYDFEVEIRIERLDLLLSCDALEAARKNPVKAGSEEAYAWAVDLVILQLEELFVQIIAKPRTSGEDSDRPKQALQLLLFRPEIQISTGRYQKFSVPFWRLWRFWR